LYLLLLLKPLKIFFASIKNKNQKYAYKGWKNCEPFDNELLSLEDNKVSDANLTKYSFDKFIHLYPLSIMSRDLSASSHFSGRNHYKPFLLKTSIKYLRFC